MARNIIRNAIEVICDGGNNYGIGHIRRSYTLAEALRLAGYQVRYRSASVEGEKILPKFVSTKNETAVRILDLPYDIRRWIEQSSNENIRTIALDYFGDAEPDLVISIYERRLPIPKGRRVCGLKYALIRPEITKCAPVSVKNGVFVMIGGSDINRVGGAIAGQLADADLSVTLIQGPAFAGEYKINSDAVTVLKAPDDIALRMASCEWAVTNGGGSMMEMMCLGKCVHVIPQTDDERNLAETIYNQGGLLGIGIDELRLPDKDEIEEIGRKARSLIDGQGVFRIIKHIDEIFHEYK